MPPSRASSTLERTGWPVFKILPSSPDWFDLPWHLPTWFTSRSKCTIKIWPLAQPIGAPLEPIQGTKQSGMETVVLWLPLSNVGHATQQEPSGNQWFTLLNQVHNLHLADNPQTMETLQSAFVSYQHFTGRSDSPTSHSNSNHTRC